MGVRSSNTTLKDEDDDYAHQIVIGDLERLSMDASVNTAAIATNAAGIATNTTNITAVAADLASLDLSAYAQKASNLSDLADVSVARTNLGLGTAALSAATSFLATASNLSDLANVGTARANLGLGSLATFNAIDNSNWSGTALALANGGTGAATASGARTNLGLGTMATQNATSVSITGGAVSVASCTGTSMFCTNLEVGYDILMLSTTSINFENQVALQYYTFGANKFVRCRQSVGVGSNDMGLWCATLVVNGEIERRSGASMPRLMNFVDGFDDKAGFSTGTLTNSPVIGNPRKWIAIRSAGVDYYIPAF